MLALFSFSGIVGNALAFYIYYKKRDKTTSNVFILSLAVTDFLVCLVVVPYTIVAELLSYRLVYDIICKVYLFCITSNVPLSAFIMVAIAFDRYFCICHPFLRVLTVERAKLGVACLTLLSFVLGVITALNYGVDRVHTSPVVNDSNVSAMVDTLGPRNSSADNQTWSYYYNGYSLEYTQTNLSNGTFNDKEEVRYNTVLVRGEYCGLNSMILSMHFTASYQKVYAALFLVSFIIVLVLYALIYRSILLRRRWRSRRKRMSCYTSVNGAEQTVVEETQMTAVNGNVNADKSALPKKSSTSRQIAIREKTLYANVKTAGMLFVVTIVFIISFLPSWLIGLQMIPFNLIVFNIYFVNNVANPFIYAFMNRAFRDDLKQLLKRCK
ncbi:neuropeptide Y receptor type 4-like [Gigantopelta aegis]|uniref:neuropeptide Y receptor type 4-like n=1 Tax=Gigantopelta aegis TaxID=1735272 RepID=UPI001B88B104|nr:neuropeptide Y receptor type 4-like [Gigantopelta aegis]